MLSKYSKILSNAPEGMNFRTEHGEIQSLKDLRAELYLKGSKFFSEYVKEENHFASWVQNAFEDYELARALRQTTNFGSFLKVLDDRINYLELWITHNKEIEEVTSLMVSDYPFQTNYEPQHHKFESADDFDLTGASEILSRNVHIEDALEKEIRMLKELNDKYSEHSNAPSFFDSINPFKRK
ncbi:MAG: hypothetical protein ABIJ34_07055 [archaeon]